jgi:hypothetical protein
MAALSIVVSILNPAAHRTRSLIFVCPSVKSEKSLTAVHITHIKLE